jgi:sugar lactone lactonase YvrE
MSQPGTFQRLVTLGVTVLGLAGAVNALLLLATPSVRAATLTTFATFNAATSTAFEEAPENLVIDRDSNVFVSLLLSNEVKKITPAGVQSPYATFTGGPGSLTAGLVINDDTGDLYVAYNPAGQSSVVYVVHPDLTKQVIATFPAGAGLNGMTPDDDGNLYVADAFLGVVWRVPAGGGSPSQLIDFGVQARGTLQLPGPNGIKFDKYHRHLYVSVSTQGTIYRIPVNVDGSVGTPAVFVSQVTPDDFAFDRVGNLYLATEPTMSVLRVAPDGTQETLASQADGLQNTTAVLFGRAGEDRLELYILSFGNPFFLPPANQHPAIYKLDVGLPGLPVSIPD